MAWNPKGADQLKGRCGLYLLPSACWAVLKVNKSLSKGSAQVLAYPEGYIYSWSILAPGISPKIRGHRMAGIDNSNDSTVRAQIKSDPTLGLHSAHRHFPDWKRVIRIHNQDWPIAGKANQLQMPPASAEDFWNLCMNCLEETFFSLGLKTPNENQMLENLMTERLFEQYQKKIKRRHS